MIVYCSRDLIFATKIGSTAESLYIPARPARDGEALRKRLEQIDDGRLNEPVAAVLIDLAMADDALAMVEQVKRHDPQLPVVCFGSHVDTQMLRDAKARGADSVLPRSSFSGNLPDILTQLAGR